MKIKDIKQIAKKSGFYLGTNITGVTLIGGETSDNTTLTHITLDELERFTNFVESEIKANTNNEMSDKN